MIGTLLARLRAANTHDTGYAGLAIGGSAIVAAVFGFFKLLSDPKIVLGFTYELQTHQFGPNCAAIVAAAFSIVGALIVALLSAWLGRPPTIPSDVASTDAAASGLPRSD